MYGIARAEQRDRLADHRVVLGHRLRGRRRDPQRPVPPSDALQLPDPGDVDEVLEPRQAQSEHRHEALTARQHLGVIAVLAQQRHHLGHRLGRVIIERGGFHEPGT